MLIMLPESTDLGKLRSPVIIVTYDAAKVRDSICARVVVKLEYEMI
jgi:hypothetical protein